MNTTKDYHNLYLKADVLFIDLCVNVLEKNPEVLLN